MHPAPGKADEDLPRSGVKNETRRKVIKEKCGDVHERRNTRNEEPEDGDVKLDDNEDPMKFPVWRKWVMTVLTTSTSLSVTFGSSVFSSAIQVMSKEFDVSEIVMLLGLSLYVGGFALGPLLW